MRYKIEKYKYFRERFDNGFKATPSLRISLSKALNNSKFLEQLYISSNSLYQAIEKYNTKPTDISPKELHHLQETINNYYLRSVFRNTPFGLFSQVSNSTTNTNSKTKSFTIGFRWFYKITQEIVLSNPKKLKYTFDNGLLTSNEKILFVKQPSNTEINQNNIQINYTHLIQLLRLFCKYPKSFEQIKSFISSHYTKVSDSYINEYTINLITKNILKPDVYLPLDSTQEHKFNILIDLCKKLSLSPLASKLTNLRKMIHKYNKSNIGSGINLLKEIKSQMNDIESIKKDDIDVNLYAQNHSIPFPTDKSKDISNMMEILCKISLPSSPLYSYIFDFIDKFGTNTEIPLGILINPYTGLGFPKQNTKEDPNFLEVQREIINYFNNKIETAILNKQDVVIEKNDVSFVENIKNKQKLRFPHAFDVCFDLNSKGMLSISEIQGSVHPYSMIGRFRGLDNSYIEDFFNQEHKNIVLCDLNVSPTKLDLGNLINNKHYTNTELSIGVNGNKDKKQINLNDILVGIDNTDLKLYLKLRNSNKKIIFLDNNMLNIDLKHPIVKLLLDISSQVNKWWFNYPWKKWSSNLSYFPCIRYKNIVIQNERWNFLPLRKTDSSSITFEQFKDQLLDFKSKFNMPETVFYVNFDNKIPMNFNDDFVYNLYKMWKKDPQSKIHFEELSSDLLNNKIHTEEVVCTLSQISNDEEVQLSNKEMYGPVYPVNLEKHWIYTDITFINTDAQVNFIKNDLPTLSNSVSKYAKKYFFIQYENDNKLPTLRYRVEAKNETYMYPIANTIAKRLFHAIHDEKIKEFTFNNYLPEVYRYGGKDYLPICETIFYWDSQLAVYAFQHYSSSIERQKLLVYSAYKYMLTRSNNMEDVIKFTDYLNIINKKDANKWFRKNKNDIVSLKDDIDLNTLIDKRQKYINVIMQSEKLSNIQKDDILLSLLHMDANRLIGVDRQLESIMMFATTDLVKNMFYTNNR